MIKQIVLLLLLLGATALVSCRENGEEDSINRDEKEQTGGEGKSSDGLIKEIIISSRVGAIQFVFSYDDNGRLVRISENWAYQEKNASGITLEKFRNDSVFFCSYSPHSSDPKKLYGFPLDSNGNISEIWPGIYLNYSDDYFIGDSNKRINGTTDKSETWTYKNGNLSSVEYYLKYDHGESSNTLSYKMGNELNNCNIDLNFFISYYGRIGHGNTICIDHDGGRKASFFLFGLLGKKSKNIVSEEVYRKNPNGVTTGYQQSYNYRVQRDDKGRIKEIDYDYQGYDIRQEKTKIYTKDKKIEFSGKAYALIFYEKSNWPNKPY